MDSISAKFTSTNRLVPNLGKRKRTGSGLLWAAIRANFSTMWSGIGKRDGDLQAVRREKM